MGTSSLGYGIKSGEFRPYLPFSSASKKSSLWLRLGTPVLLRILPDRRLSLWLLHQRSNCSPGLSSTSVPNTLFYPWSKRMLRGQTQGGVWSTFSFSPWLEKTVDHTVLLPVVAIQSLSASKGSTISVIIQPHPEVPSPVPAMPAQLVRAMNISGNSSCNPGHPEPWNQLHRHRGGFLSTLGNAAMVHHHLDCQRQL